VKLKKKRIFK